MKPPTISVAANSLMARRLKKNWLTVACSSRASLHTQTRFCPPCATGYPTPASSARHGCRPSWNNNSGATWAQTPDPPKTPTTTHHQRENEHVQQRLPPGIPGLLRHHVRRWHGHRRCAQYLFAMAAKACIHHHSFHEIKKPPCPSPCRPPFSLAPHVTGQKPCPEEATR